MTPSRASRAGRDYKWICLYQFDSWRGTLHGLFYCQDYRTAYHFFSWVNRQTPGTIGRFKNINRVEIANTGPAYSESSLVVREHLDAVGPALLRAVGRADK